MASYNPECRVAAPVLLQLYQILMILVGVVGNGFVIYASKQYSTFNLDSNTIFLVRHLGYADIAILVLGFLPANFMFLGNLEQNDQHFKYICTFQGICMNVFGLTVLSITAGISVHRLLRCTLPQAIAQVRRNMTLSLVAMCYLAATGVAVIVMIVPPRLKYRYDNGYYSCIGHFVNEGDNDREKLVRAFGMALSGLFFLIIILINVLLHHFSKKKLANLQGNSMHKKKHKTSRYRTLTTHSISALLILTWLPFATTFFITISTESNVEKARSECQPSSLIRHISTFVFNFYLLNFVLNPFLYCVTNINFMKFVMKLIKRTCNHYLCAMICSKINPDLDISTNVSTCDQFPGSSNNCPIAPERVYSNMLNVPDSAASTKRKLHNHSPADPLTGTHFLIEAGKSGNKVIIDIKLTDNVDQNDDDSDTADTKNNKGKDRASKKKSNKYVHKDGSSNRLKGLKHQKLFKLKKLRKSTDSEDMDKPIDDNNVRVVVEE